MITKAQMMDVLLEVCPAFRPTWHSFIEDWKDEPEPPLYLALSGFARHVIGMLARGETGSFPTIFIAVERLQTEGDDYVSEAAIVGLLEDLQNRNLHTTTEPQQFRPFLGKQSLSAWDELYEFWDKVGLAKSAALLDQSDSLSPQIDPESVTDPELRQIIQQLYRKT